MQEMDFGRFGEFAEGIGSMKCGGCTKVVDPSLSLFLAYAHTLLDNFFQGILFLSLS